MVTAINQKLASFEKRLSEVADCSANFFVADQRFSNIETRVKEVAGLAAEVRRRTHLLRRGLE
ncbi:hypothetical protein DPMN_157070 [Dreissena polymorpha]|uniref:Uncharacterized protein n=1 Tax=Dreissena polymorpha TaxID=45954 RepID=A0A9D4ILX7_DREPO|nr:hypothetical protein DPMN_157070 [Dreissena polymorpha]